MAAFTGIPVAALDFYEDLEADNSKTWWAAHKETYDEIVRRPMAALVTDLKTNSAQPNCFGRTVTCVSRKTRFRTRPTKVLLLDLPRAVAITCRSTRQV